jgi:hypothetical protein
MYLFVGDKRETNAAISAEQSGCVYPRCGKVRTQNSAYCLRHVLVIEWEKGEPERRRKRAELLRERRRQEEEFLAASPLRAINSQSTEPPQKRRAKTTIQYEWTR